MVKLAMREQDDWLYAVSFMGVIFGAIALYASVLRFRVPTFILSLSMLAFTTLVIKKHYGKQRANIHIFTYTFFSALFALSLYLLTN